MAESLAGVSAHEYGCDDGTQLDGGKRGAEFDNAEKKSETKRGWQTYSYYAKHCSRNSAMLLLH